MREDGAHRLGDLRSCGQYGLLRIGITGRVANGEVEDKVPLVAEHDDPGVTGIARPGEHRECGHVGPALGERKGRRRRDSPEVLAMAVDVILGECEL